MCPQRLHLQQRTFRRGAGGAVQTASHPLVAWPVCGQTWSEFLTPVHPQSKTVRVESSESESTTIGLWQWPRGCGGVGLGGFGVLTKSSKVKWRSDVGNHRFRLMKRSNLVSTFLRLSRVKRRAARRCCWSRATSASLTEWQASRKACKTERVLGSPARISTASKMSSSEAIIRLSSSLVRGTKKTIGGVGQVNRGWEVDWDRGAVIL